MIGKSQEKMLRDVDPQASLWLLIPQLSFSIAVSSLIIIGIFWFYFGEISDFSVAFAVFLSVMQILMVIGYRFRERQDYHAQKEANFGLLDKIGGFWLIACTFGAFLAWICGQLAMALPGTRSAMYVAAAFFSICLPVATLLPNLRYVGGKAAFVQIPLFVFVTTLPVLEGVYYLFKIMG